MKYAKILKAFSTELRELAKSEDPVLEQAYLCNNWFTEDNVRFALESFADTLNDQDIDSWLDSYATSSKPKNVGIVMAGNIPLVGLHDLLCVICSGHKAWIKVSSSDKVLTTWVVQTLVNIDPSLSEQMEMVDRVNHADAVIATGSNNTSRYFEYYFKDIPHIIRKNRSSVAVITGNETAEEMEGLSDDIFRYFGLGCRNVSKVFLPEGYDLEKFYPAMNKWAEVINHNKYANNYTYHKAIFSMNGTPHFDNNFLILKADEGWHSPLSCAFYEHYKQIDTVVDKLRSASDQLQCIVGHIDFAGILPFGNTQKTTLFDYADGVDTMRFLTGI
jgi:hypothetical protein